jgi:hypothetical protein
MTDVSRSIADRAFMEKLEILAENSGSLREKNTGCRMPGSISGSPVAALLGFTSIVIWRSELP